MIPLTYLEAYYLLGPANSVCIGEPYYLQNIVENTDHRMLIIRDQSSFSPLDRHTLDNKGELVAWFLPEQSGIMAFEWCFGSAAYKAEEKFVVALCTEHSIPLPNPRRGAIYCPETRTFKEVNK